MAIKTVAFAASSAAFGASAAERASSEAGQSFIDLAGNQS
jgi:hypothetical protein